MSVSDNMMGYLESAPSPAIAAIAWKSLEKLNEDHTRVKKLQLKTELNTVKQGNMSIDDYASKIKTITNSLGSIGVTVDDDDVVAATLTNSLGSIGVTVDDDDVVAASNVECWTCGEQGHYSNECPTTRTRPNNRGRGRRQQNNYAATNRNNNDDDQSEQLFVMQDMVDAMNANVHAGDSVWYVDSSASNHMTSHGEWFKEMKQLDGPGYVETGDNSAHPIAHVENIPLQMQDSKMKYLADVLCVPNITKSLVSVGQMIEQGLQVRFNPNGCYVEDYNNGCKLITEDDVLFTINITSITQFNHI
ncbi:hypothetical protein L7F22_013816 [Adiantum nelumboides]|nr:hypothetical protein [Adiantum nelumboides]